MYVPRKTQLTADALSHASIETVNDIEFESAVEEYSISSVRMVFQSCKWDTDIFSKIYEEKKKGLEISKIRKFCTEGLPVIIFISKVKKSNTLWFV